MYLNETEIQDPLWQIAYDWLCERRSHYPHNCDIWDVRWRWNHPVHRERDTLYQLIQTRKYHLSPMQLCRTKSGEQHVIWSARDALVLKWVSLQLHHVLPLHPACAHIQGHGGVTGSREEVYRILNTPEFRLGFVFRTDIRGYYRNMVRARIWQHLKKYVPSDVISHLLKQYLSAIVDDGGTFFIPMGICRGCAMSPLIGATILYDLDEAMASLVQNGVYYTRYMDDILILSSTRWAMRRARRQILEYFDNKGFEIHPDKTQVGRIPQCRFDWLGWEFKGNTVTAAPRALNNFRQEYHRRSQDMKYQGINGAERRNRLRQYSCRWRTWLALTGK